MAAAGRGSAPLADGIVEGGEQGGRGQKRVDELSRVEWLVVRLKTGLCLFEEGDECSAAFLGAE
jgi:hypothetical protein